MGAILTNCSSKRHDKYEATNTDQKDKQDIELHQIVLHQDEAILDIITSPEWPQQTMSCSNDGRIVHYDWKTKAIINEWNGHSKGVERLCFGTRSQCLFSGSRDTTIRQWKMNDAAKTSAAIFKGHTLPVSGLALTLDERTLCSGSRDYNIKFWDISSQKIISNALINRNVCTFIKRCDNHTFAQTSEDLMLRIWDARKGKSPVRQTPSGAYFPLSCDVSADGKYILTTHTGFDKDGCEVKVWDCRTLKDPLHILVGHDQAVYSGIFLAQEVCVRNGNRSKSRDDGVGIDDIVVADMSADLADYNIAVTYNIASVSKDKTVRIWSLKTGESIIIQQSATSQNGVPLTELRCIASHGIQSRDEQENINSLIDNKYIYTADGQGCMQQWIYNRDRYNISSIVQIAGTKYEEETEA